MLIASSTRDPEVLYYCHPVNEAFPVCLYDSIYSKPEIMQDVK